MEKGVKAWVGIVISTLLALGSVFASWNSLSNDNARTKEKVEHLEKQRDQDRREAREDLSEVKGHVKIIDQNVQLILQTIKAMDAVQKAERRAGRTP